MMRYTGSLISLAIGDALGAPLEGSLQSFVRTAEMLPGGRHFRNAGAITDDTLMAIAVAESLVNCGRFEQKDMILRFFTAYRSRPEWFGLTTSLFLDLVKSGTPPQSAATKVHRRHGSRSNGSVMRGFPVGIFFPVPEVYAVSLEVSLLTHLDPTAAHSSAWLNTMTSCLCRGSSRHEAFRCARSLCTNPEVHRMLGNYPAYDPIPSLDAVLCAHAALHSFMTTRSLEDALIDAVSRGGDADTVGACCGALAGAYYGLDAVPGRWAEKLEGYDRIRNLGERLWAGRADC